MKEGTQCTNCLKEPFHVYQGMYLCCEHFKKEKERRVAYKDSELGIVEGRPYVVIGYKKRTP